MLHTHMKVHVCHVPSVSDTEVESEAGVSQFVPGHPGIQSEIQDGPD